VGRTGRGIWLSLALLVASAALLGAAARYETPAAAAVVAKPRTALEGVAARIAGKPVRLRCGGVRQWNAVGEGVLGYAVVGSDLTTLAPRVCARLAAMRSGAEPADLLLSGAALVTVAHEAEHLRGIASEAVAECYAIQQAITVADAIDIDRAYARLALQAYWAAYPERPPAYRSRECYDGGALDLRPRAPGWP
jgi:hypothetical protein